MFFRKSSMVAVARAPGTAIAFRRRARREVAKSLGMTDVTDRKSARRGWVIFLDADGKEAVAIQFVPLRETALGLRAWDDPFVNAPNLVYQTWDTGTCGPASTRIIRECGPLGAMEVNDAGVHVHLDPQSTIAHRFCRVKRTVGDALGIVPSVHISSRKVL